jgi:hypothetical protein
MAAAPVISATSRAGGLGIAVKNTSALVELLVERGIAIEVTHRSKRRLYGLKDLALLREEASLPRRPTPGRRRGRPPRGATKPAIVAENSSAVGRTPLLADRQSLSHSSARSSISRILTAGCSRPMGPYVGQRLFSIGSQSRCPSVRANPMAIDWQVHDALCIEEFSIIRLVTSRANGASA